MFNSGHIEPNWDINEFKALNYKFDTHKDDNLLNEFASHGHSKMYMTLWNYFQPNPFPNVVWDYIVPQFSLDHVSVAINMFTPGQYLPLHYDLFGKYKQHHGLAKQDITRCIIMLEDSVPGQISQACGRTIGEWKAGDWISWDNDDIHAIYNMSTVNRYAIQLTGTKQ
jgi:hypothetical protein